MFERYTDLARKAIFHARYEASQFGSPYIETEHLLLGILRADRGLAARLPNVQAIQQEVEKQLLPARREKVSTSVDIPVSHPCKRAMAHAAQISTTRHDNHITNEHLLLGVLREEQCLAAGILTENGVTVSVVEQELDPDKGGKVIELAGVPMRVPTAMPAARPPIDLRDLTAAAGIDALTPLIGRERELDRVIQILVRRTRRNPVLIGESGVGKSAIVHGLARRIFDYTVPLALADRSILEIDAASLIAGGRGREAAEAALRKNAIIYVHGLFDLASEAAGWDAIEALRLLEPNSELQCIATGTAAGFRLTMQKARSLAENFEAVAVLPPTEEETMRILSGIKGRYETFHGVSISEEAIETAVAASRWFLRHRQLPDRAIDLIDDAAAQAKVRRETEPRETAEIRKHIRLIDGELEEAIASHDFTRARKKSEAERTERDRLREALDQQTRDERAATINRADVLEAVAARAGVPVAAVETVLRVKDAGEFETAAREIAALLPTGGPEWAETLVSFLAGCTTEEAEKLAAAIRNAHARLNPQ